MELYFLGTSAGSPTKYRNVTSLLLDLSHLRLGFFLVDCGEGTQHQIMRSPYKISKINHILITHLHGDHIFGLAGVLTHRSMQNIAHELHLYGPVGIKEYVETVLRISDSYLRYPLHIHEISENSVLLNHERLHLSCHALEHRVPCYAYRFEEKSAHPKTVVISGDNLPSIQNSDFAKNADVLVHEASYKHELAHKAIEYKHATSTMIASLAKEANVKQLIITHISPRYWSKEDQEALLDECTAIFPNTLLAQDHWSFKC